MKKLLTLKENLSSFIFHLSSCQRAFTLIELLVVMAVLLAVGTIVAVILFSSLRGANKTDTLTLLRENGNFAVSQIAKMVRSAKHFDGVSRDGVNYMQTCPTAAQPYAYIKITSFDNDTTVFACTTVTISSNSASLLNTNSVMLTPNSCFFSCSQSSQTDAPVIGINFSLDRRQAGGIGVAFERTGNVTFQTSVTLRNTPR